MDIWIVTEQNEKDDILPKKLVELCEQNGISAEIKTFEQFKDTPPAAPFPKVAFFRGYTVELYVALEKHGVRVIDNDFCVRTCWDKVVTHKLLEKHGVNLPKTLFYKHAVTYEEMKAEFGAEFVVKERFGRSGERVHLVKNEEQFYKATENIDPRRLMYQEFIRESFGRDLRVLVLGDEIIGELYRVNANATDFRSNVAQGGKRINAHLTPAQRQEAIRTARLIKGEFVSVDYLIRGDELVLCETNTNPGITKYYYDLGYDIPLRVFEYLRKALVNHNA